MLCRDVNGRGNNSLLEMSLRSEIPGKVQVERRRVGRCGVLSHGYVQLNYHCLVSWARFPYRPGLFSLGAVLHSSTEPFCNPFGRIPSQTDHFSQKSTDNIKAFTSMKSTPFAKYPKHKSLRAPPAFLIAQALHIPFISPNVTSFPASRSTIP